MPLWRVVVDRDRCMGSGVCVALAASLFVLDDERSRPRAEHVAPDETVLDAADCCPARAVTVTENGRVIGPRD
ncbi:ferredoxin [Embleya scabrispora]|uniref:ferredoxin n=1 Tax=Embleya scabrispora TaxID=159449 RepID=UPI001F477778|nr:ferredoxin [Embleya scabrispora]